MVSLPAHARWCTRHERHYGGVCPLCQHDVPAHQIRQLERAQSPALQTPLATP